MATILGSFVEAFHLNVTPTTHRSFIPVICKNSQRKIEKKWRKRSPIDLSTSASFDVYKLLASSISTEGKSSVFTGSIDFYADFYAFRDISQKCKFIYYAVKAYELHEDQLNLKERERVFPLDAVLLV